MKQWTTKCLVLAGVVIWWAIALLPDGRMRVVMCDVGQGDAFLISYGFVQFLIDTGPDDSVLDCLSKFVPFYDSTLELVLITHDQADHTGGLVYVRKRYRLLHLVQGSTVRSGTRIKAGGLEMRIESTTGEDENDQSLVTRMAYGNFNILFTGDAEAKVWENLDNLREIDVLKVPHHGSKDALNPSVLGAFTGGVALIPVGKDNSYGHPASETIDMLSKAGWKIKRSDIDQEVVIVSDGKKYWIQ